MTHRNAWIGDLVASASGIVQRSDGRVAIGAVLLIENAAGEIVVVTKAPKPGYEFSGSDTLPGGMLRSGCAGPIRPDDLRRAAFGSLSRPKRALRYGIGGAFAFRSVALIFGLYLMGVGLVKLAGAVYL